MGRVGFPEEAKGQSDAVTTKACSDVIDEIIQMEGVAIPAHVNLDGSGIFKKVQGISLRQALANEGLLAIEVTDTSYPKPSVYEHLKLSLAEVIGSDSHHPLSAPESRIGDWYTWIKMEKPSCEALRLALHDGVDGTIRCDAEQENPNEVHQRFFLKSLIVRNAYRAGRGQSPLRVDFSPWFSTIIGGRGTGKSTVVNFLRIVLDNKTNMPESIQRDFESFCEIGHRNGGGMLLDNSEIELILIKDGRELKLKWDRNSGKYLEFEKGENGFTISGREISNIKELYPINIFSQKELYELTQEPSTLMELIDKQFNKAQIIEELEGKTSDWMQKRNQIRQIQNQISEEQNLQSEYNSVVAKISAIEEKQNNPILKDYSSGQKINDSLSVAVEGLKNLGDEIMSIENKFPEKLFPTIDSDSLDQVSFSELNQLAPIYDVVKERFYLFKNEFDSFLKAVSDTMESIPWKQTFSELLVAYNQFVQNQDENDLGAESHEQLVIRKEAIETRLSNLASQKDRLVNLEEEAENVFNEIIELKKNLRKKRKETIEQINTRISRIGLGEGANALSLVLEFDPLKDIDNSESEFRNLIRKQGSTFSNDILVKTDGLPSRGLIQRIIGPSEEDVRWELRDQVLTELVQISEEDTKGYSVRFARHIVSLGTNSPEDLDRLRIWVPGDIIKLQLKRGREIRQIETGSAGQRTAAMLSFLMALDDSPLIIDQPEDDLDTRLITDLVVEGVKRLKNSRQIIVVTHNPNVAVNGCAENIVEMQFGGGQITANVYGALQNRESRHAVCEVMEGGKIALDNRYYRISKAIS